MFKLTGSSPDIKLTIQWLDKFVSTAREPSTMAAGVKHLGRDMQKVFRSEGAHGGRGWQPLTEHTQFIRESRGYNPSHPILVQSGGLKGVTADTLARWNLGMATIARSDGSGKANMLAYVSPLTFFARANGAKVQNHGGARLSYPRQTGAVPARPFFGMTNEGVEAALTEINKRLMTQWASKSSKVRVR